MELDRNWLSRGKKPAESTGGISVRGKNPPIGIIGICIAGTGSRLRSFVNGAPKNLTGAELRPPAEKAGKSPFRRSRPVRQVTNRSA
ncbi:Hypothetical protein NTJ_08969 [Nesidiocoris tenuis]|uniref:Nucleotidyl transferase domain-containing protein n=1 Tax=Nesidiocoris tenuis TaxID=355587 RepID=A0ABN7AVD4_9HEMI|nr:Hypothetical protein NTJ_08969 [Nesidiocoris tenuis]